VLDDEIRRILADVENMYGYYGLFGCGSGGPPPMRSHIRTK
jgi:hypothetical protein